MILDAIELTACPLAVLRWQSEWPLWRLALRALVVDKLQPIEDLGDCREGLAIACPVCSEYLPIPVGHVHRSGGVSLRIARSEIMVNATILVCQHEEGESLPLP
jgi:hypothetical protein